MDSYEITCSWAEVCNISLNMGPFVILVQVAIMCATQLVVVKGKFKICLPILDKLKGAQES